MKPKPDFERVIPEPPQDEPRASGARLRAARTASHEPQARRCQQLRQVLMRYLSPILVDSVLERALNARGLTQSSLAGADLAELTSDMMLGLRLFVAERRLPELMLELAEILEGDER